MNRKKLCVNLSLFVGVSCSVAAMENPVYEMDRIVVTATRAEQAIEKIPNGIAVINKDQIEKSGAIIRQLQQLTAHKGLPYLFICGTFIGSEYFKIWPNICMA